MQIINNNNKWLIICIIKLDNGDGVPINKKKAIEYYKKAADSGNVDGMVNYAYKLFNGDGVPTNKEESIKYYEMAAKNGNKQAINYLKSRRK